MTYTFIRNVLLKALALFAILSLGVGLLPPLRIGRWSGYNWIFPGRARLPFGETPEKSYNLSLYDLDAMFAAHEISGAPAEGEYRVVVLGDSSVWGTLLAPEQTLAGRLDAAGLTCAGRPARVYNLGYPTLSLTKDAMLLRRALAYRPDLIVWPLTLESFPRGKQLESPLAANNAAELRGLQDALGADLGLEVLPEPSFWQRTLFGRRRALADLLRLQLYGVKWAATGIDQDYPADYPPAQVDLDPDLSYHGLTPPDLPADALAWEVLEASMRLAREQGVPVVLVNEPMLVSAGENSDVRYNFFYPRWAYDAWREELTARAAAAGVPLLDLWDALPPDAFTNSAIHLTPEAQARTAELIAPALCPGR